jgi:ferritin-like metal-binding protein YciE
MDQQSLQELLVDNVRDLYDAEKQLVKTLPKLAKAAESDELADAIRAHLEQTEGHVSRLENVFETLGVSIKGRSCKGMKGLVEEGQKSLKTEKDGIRRDLAIIAAAQRVEHYEISAYGTMRTIAEQIGNTEAADLLQQTGDEEKDADHKLTEVAMHLYMAGSDGDEVKQEKKSPRARKPRQTAGRRRSVRRAMR